MPERLRVAIIGGGCASMAAAYELTKPDLESRYEVTVYQMGWRLGGKGASGRGKGGRIEEHGLHLWMGYYENAFRLMRECYAELARDPERHRIARWSDAFVPANSNAVADWSPSRRCWLPWLVDFPAAPGLPGEAGAQLWTVAEYLARAAALLGELLRTLDTGGIARESSTELFRDLKTGPMTPESLSSALGQIARYGALLGIGATIEATRVLEAALKASTSLPQSSIARFLDVVASLLRVQLGSLTRDDDRVRRLWEVIDVLLAVIRGSIRFRLAVDPRGLDAIDDYDSREWLRVNGASEESINSACVRAFYDFAFAYENGDPSLPRVAAGTALRAAARAFFTYRGAFFWKMTAGMGDIVFAPLYEVLKRRGVRFEFFHKLTNVGLSGSTDDAVHVHTLDFDVQARSKRGEYEPLVVIGDLPCWPARPDYAQLVDGSRIHDEGWDLESQWDSRRAGTRTLQVGQDFDFVVLGTSIGVVPYVCREILERDSRWRQMVERVKSVPTQAFQIWMNCDLKELGWSERPISGLAAFVKPFDTWADMTHVGGRESWSVSPQAIVYFCNVLQDAPDRPSPDASSSDAAGAFVGAQQNAVRDNAIAFLNGDISLLWKAAQSSEREFRWEVLKSEFATTAICKAPFESQYWTANVRPSDRYCQAMPGSTRFRISPLDRTYDNLTIAGDWTSCGLNMGCVEAAVMSGLLASHAIARFPPLSHIVGYDHP
jgi:uncharacterized protein with NAD-binding domain and iron-sulfur cluster